MGRVSWSDQAEADLNRIAPAVADQIRRNAEKILHDIPPLDHPADEGALGDGFLWHRGVAHGRHTEQEEQDDGPQNYFLLYRKRDSDPEFEILAVPSEKQVASKWAQMTREPRDTGYAQSL